MITTAMTAATWAALLSTFTIAVVVPGPDTFLILRLGVRERRAAMLAACGIMLGNFIWTLGSVLGLAALMRALPGALPALQTVGAGVLVWIGFQSIRGGIRAIRHRNSSAKTPPPTAVSARPFRLGLITNLSNPKALLFFAALFSQLLPVDATVFDRVLIVVALGFIGLGWFLTFAWLTSSAPFQRWFRRVTPLIDMAAGAVFLTVAGLVLTEVVLTEWR